MAGEYVHKPSHSRFRTVRWANYMRGRWVFVSLAFPHSYRKRLEYWWVCWPWQWGG